MLCRIYQWRISSAIDDGLELGPATARHAAECPRCHQFLQSARSLETAFRKQAFAAAAPEPPATNRLPTYARRLVLIPGLAAAAAFILVLVLGDFTDSRAPVPQPPTVVSASPPGLADLAGTFGLDLHSQTYDSLLADASNPMRRELDNLADDAHRTTAALLTYLPLDPGSVVSSD